MSAAEEKALSAIAICDHDTTDGIESCIKIGNTKGIEVISGIELTVDIPDNEIHILGYLIDWRLGWLQKKLKAIQDGRVNRIHKMIEKLEAMDIRIKAADVFGISGQGSVGRLHLARAIIKSGAAKSFREVFEKYLGYGRPCYVPNIKFEPQEAIRMVIEAGGVPVIAHPGVLNRDEYIKELVDYGLMGIEVYHSDHNANAVRHYEEMAKDLGLLITGGSDCHGAGKGKALIGTVRVPYDLVDKLKEAAKR